ncbi:hypothetical protein [Microbacterium sp. T2.11-28]|uniref:hypothetical protein n=1 Tax=Microbacterium sp. T2.11-28 TaxID=3041169 RepID=UPI002477CB5C|nr:hypothetical protein [Microbacterium sp. T2.11-28]CAI9386084.1 hypothetical protein MICABA_00164 [Microbacterium sp. T2.11-28]
MDHVIIDAGTLEFNEEDLTATGLLIPYGVAARSNLGTFTFAAGDITIPTDLTGMSLNLDHKREDVVGGFTKAWEQPEQGVMATFKYRDTPEGRAAFTEGKEGKRRHLSAEVAKVRIQAGKALPGAILFAASQVEKPAFEGATLLAAEDTAVPMSADGIAEALDHHPVDGHLNLAVSEIPNHITVTTPTGDAATYTPDAAPAEDNPEGGSTVTATATEPGQTPAPAAAPGTLLATNGTPVEAIEKAYELGSIFAAMHTLRTPGDLSGKRAEAETLLAALSDIKLNTTGGLTTATGGVIPPAWVGKVWQGKKYQRKFLDLATHLFGGINATGRKGFKIDQGTALVKHWSGNKTELPTGSASTSVIAATRRQYGYAADIAREFFDLEGGEEIVEAFIQGVVDSYAEITDIDALTDIIGLASGSINLTTGVITADGSRILPPETDYPAEYPAAMALVIEAIDAVTDANDDPGFVLVNRAAWRQLRFTPKDLVPEYVTFAVKGTGDANADNVIVKRAPDAQFADAGFDNANPAVVAGAKSAIEFRELGETPIQLDALDIARGGVDKAVVGYMETFPIRPEAMVAYGTEAA